MLAEPAIASAHIGLKTSNSMTLKYNAELLAWVCVYSIPSLCAHQTDLTSLQGHCLWPIAHHLLCDQVLPPITCAVYGSKMSCVEQQKDSFRCWAQHMLI